MLAKNKKIKDSLIYEAKGVIGLKYRDNINQINSFLRNSFNNHIIYLHKKRIKELINYANR